MLGHASAAMTLDTYADLFADDLDEVAMRLDRAASLESDQVTGVGRAGVGRPPRGWANHFQGTLAGPVGKRATTTRRNGQRPPCQPVPDQPPPDSQWAKCGHENDLWPITYRAINHRGVAFHAVLEGPGRGNRIST
jgi:hypothetical protein